MFWLILQCLGAVCLVMMIRLGPKKGCSASALLIAGLIGYYIYLSPNTDNAG